MNKTVERFLLSLRSQVGVPFIPNGREAFRGLDCSGLIIVAGQATGFDVKYRSDYSIGGEDFSASLISYLEQNCDQVENPKQAKPGDILLFGYGANSDKPRHCGVLTDKDTFVHCAEKPNGVRESDFTETWQRIVHSAWRFRGMK